MKFFCDDYSLKFFFTWSAHEKEGGNSAISCMTCRKSLAGEVYLKCAKCANFIQCFECASVGVETMTHSQTHNYLIIEVLKPPIYQEDWRAAEEVLMLGIQVCCFGNWNEIAAIVQMKSSTE
jgi:hypothetical protein